MGRGEGPSAAAAAAVPVGSVSAGPVPRKRSFETVRAHRGPLNNGGPAQEPGHEVPPLTPAPHAVLDLSPPPAPPARPPLLVRRVRRDLEQPKNGKQNIKDV